MQSDPRIIPYLHRIEGKVLKAYRCPAGVWTIGGGLTAASGVVKPHAGMAIGEAEADRLLQLALVRNYEPAVIATLGAQSPHAIAGSTSFHFNTGAIGRAGWAKAFLAGRLSEVRTKLGQWRKGGGRVLPGLVRRRREEGDIILDNIWPADLDVTAAPPTPAHGGAPFVISATASEIAEIRDGFALLGLDPGTAPGEVARPAVIAFQTKYGLTIDGLIGRATLSALQRELDARRKTTQTAAAGGAGGVTAGVNETVSPGGAPAMAEPIVTWIGIGVLSIAIIGLGVLAFRYRDVIAARLHARVPRIAAWLRSF